ncbi:MAG: hypothetical protein V7K40_00405 [Nostoc sp.]|uniref:hypothetical protein n=1 Tax=Nostoc sp. TaxID=1180 RepID=UPI002FFBC2B1
MKGDQPTSINIVGENHIGKSSLLHYFVRILEQRVLQNTSRYAVIYLPLRGVDCQTETIIPQVLEVGVQYFRELWRSLAESDRSLLRRIIHGEIPTPQDKGVVRKLTRKEILTQKGNAFQVPLVQKYIEQLLEEE